MQCIRGYHADIQLQSVELRWCYEKSGLLERKQKEIDVWRRAERETYVQYMIDTLMLTMNDPKIVGRDVFGEERIVKVVKGWMEKFDDYHEAIEGTKMSDYYRAKMDEGLGRILKKKGVAPWKKRYPWLEKLRY